MGLGRTAAFAPMACLCVYVIRNKLGVGGDALQTDAPYFDIETTIRREEVIHPLSDAFMQFWNLLCLLWSEIKFIIECYHSALCRGEQKRVYLPLVLFENFKPHSQSKVSGDSSKSQKRCNTCRRYR